MKKIITLFLIGALPSINSAQINETPNAVQSGKSCGTTEYLEYQKSLDPNFEANQQKIEQQITDYIQNQKNSKGGNISLQSIVTIPVVFHIIYNSAAENVSSTNVYEQVAMMNQDFSKTNADLSLAPDVFESLAGNVNIQFCLASVDPFGKPTNGIVRVKTSKKSFSWADGMKSAKTGGSNAWDTKKYLNIWVCNLGNGLYGYSTFPGSDPAKDGVAMNYQYLGSTGVPYPVNKGRTVTHEVGHYLGLNHIWGDASCGDDKVADTPTQRAANYGCVSFPHITCSNGPNGDMFCNFMDYSDDICMVMFTIGQCQRIAPIFAPGGARYSLLSSNGCGTPSAMVTQSYFDAGVEVSPYAEQAAKLSNAETNQLYLEVFPNPASGNTNLIIPISGNAQLMLTDILGRPVRDINLNTVTAESNVELDLSGLSSGTYLIRLTIDNTQFIKRINKN